MRFFDFVVSLAVIVLLSPVLLAVAVAVKLHDGGPVLYGGRRVGRNGRIFRVLKFRTMVPDAETRGPGVTAGDDSRITPVGRFLRKTKLDELPQFMNVLKGEMSLVGPRPEDPRYVALYTDEQKRLLEVRPGITSPASVAYRHEESLLTGEEWERAYIGRILPHKLQIEAEYQKRRTLLTDLGVILRTVGAVLDREPGSRTEGPLPKDAPGPRS
jgi:lipopolysaccharide/colanic/teichoic acid biosynthesis glycosyltransferase